MNNCGVPLHGTIKIMPPTAAYLNFSLFTLLFSLKKAVPMGRPFFYSFAWTLMNSARSLE